MKRIVLLVTSIPILAGAIGFALPAEQAGLISDVVMAAPPVVWERLDRQSRQIGATLVTAEPPERLVRVSGGLRETFELRPSGPATLVTVRGEVRIDNPYSRLAAYLLSSLEVRLRQDLHSLEPRPS